MCILCQIEDTNYINELEKNKHKKVKLMIFYFDLFNTLNECSKIVHEAWTGEYYYTFRYFYDGTKSGISLIDWLDY